MSQTEAVPKHWREPEPGSDPSEDDEDVDPQILLMRANHHLFNGAIAGPARDDALLERIRNQRESRDDDNMMLTIRIALQGIVPRIWRRVRVPAASSTFHKKVVVPVVGWAPYYHGYFFMLKPFKKSSNSWGLGTGIGPIK